MVSVSRFWSKVNQWLRNIPTKALNASYQSALAIKAIEDQHFGGKMISPEVEGGQSVYEYYKTVLDRELTKINFNLTQLRIGNFLDLGQASAKNVLDISEKKAESESEILDKLRFIETVISKYRQKQGQENIEPGFPTKPINSNRESTLIFPEAIREKSDAVLEDRDKSRPLRGNKLSPQYEQKVIGQLRQLREQRKITIRIVVLLLLFPLLVNILAKNLIFRPFIDNLRVDQIPLEQIKISEEIGLKFLNKYRRYRDDLEVKQLLNPDFDKIAQQEKLKEKAKELLLEAGYESKEGSINILADLTALLIFTAIVYFRRRDCRVALSFLSYNFTELNVVTKVFIFILLTDMFVGFHSAEGWEVILVKSFEHFGLAENNNFNGIFIATIPVIIDSTFKLLIFNYFTRTSPTSVAVLEKMNQ
ncbi:CemA family [Xenococcus sp. PCC 7305]|uniref:hypothetical protein n=1 Tax=Xenococcus sp. PCC 7305 TaxID=102125 RepID=UPI0002ACEC77|nr:hypothetical protein [Xenococcus sp. PCC 7305]ELS04656.1 CemA family [Xenococcus sp. PCC 7305]